MKPSKILEDDENIVVVPLCWTTPERRMKFIRDGYQVIPIAGYKETKGFRAFKIIGPYSDDINVIKELSIPIWEDWKLTARYAVNRQIFDNTNMGIQMFDHLDDDEKIQALKYDWFTNALGYIDKYFRKHPELLERARHSLTLKDIRAKKFKGLFR